MSDGDQVTFSEFGGLTAYAVGDSKKFLRIAALPYDGGFSITPTTDTDSAQTLMLNVPEVMYNYVNESNVAASDTLQALHARVTTLTSSSASDLATVNNALRARLVLIEDWILAHQS